MSETRNRILIAVYAYAYEIKSNPLITDAEFDKLALEINLEISTGNIVMDEWFKGNFTPYSGCWVHNHPNLKRIKELYNTIKSS